MMMMLTMACSNLAVLLFSLCCIVVSAGAFDVTSKNNVAVYYGQGPNQRPLSVYCADSNIDIIILSFVHLFPQQANGYPGINFGNQCSGERYSGPGAGAGAGAGVQKDASRDSLMKCPDLQRDLQSCRRTNKKVLLSLGGATPEYQLNGPLDGADFAHMLWGMFGPRQESWVSKGLPRPFDDGAAEFAVDGFDLDIEHAPADNNFAGYKALVSTLREIYASHDGGGKTYYLTASPQCIVPDANMAEILNAAAFDMIFVQFYNTPTCSARRWADANPNYTPGGGGAARPDPAGLTFESWVWFLASSPHSQNARVYLGLPGSPAAANPGSYVTSAQARALASAFYCNGRFGGISIWEATYAAGNIEGGRNLNFFQNAKASLKGLWSDPRIPCGVSRPGYHQRGVPWIG
ncbi:carbohydrate-binding module family 18 protein [Xylaria sp. CBS 124048]|nr:carbohydrate-binding module family 18 protein [Xylaria sp. CBS 124048]